MTDQEINELLSYSGTPCISIIVPMHRIAPDRIKDIETVNNAITLAKELMINKYGKQNPSINDLIQNLDAIAEKMDYVHSKDGIGIFASPQMIKMIKFPFPVVEKIKTGDVFDSRDLLYHLHTIINYYVLAIGKKYIRLFHGKGENLQEVGNGDFPMHYVETYEYSKTSRGTSFGNTLKAFEADKSVLQEIRMIDFFKTADHLLEKYAEKQVPIILSGGRKEIADYLKITQNKKIIIGKVEGNYDFNSDLKRSTLAWVQIRKYQKNQNNILLSNLHELMGKKMLAIGIEEVWKAAQEGKGLELVLEKDFECPLYIETNGYDIKFHKPNSSIKKYDFVTDAVEKIIKTVREKQGKVTFVENGEMKDFNGIAIKLRYS